MKKTVLVALYDNPDKFPPTLNAINELVKLNNKVIVLCRNPTSHKKFNLNEKTNCIGIDINDNGNLNSSAWLKLLFFIRFTLHLWRCNIKFRPQINLVYDSYSFAGFHLIKSFVRKTKLWYHNHDVTDLKFVSKKSLTYWCWKIEQKHINNATIFSLPDLSRSKFFNYQNPICFLPNYPNLCFNTNNLEKQNSANTLKVIYQGRVSAGHGIFEFIKYLKQTKYKITLHIIGSYDNVFKEEISTFVNANKLTDKVFLLNPIPYLELKHFTKNFDIGLGILQPINAAYSTAATASNKIYEYIAFGMPVILFDNKHYKDALQKYSWAKFTDLSENSFDIIFADLMKNHQYYAQQAYKDYRNQLHFEKHFLPIYQKIIN